MTLGQILDLVLFVFFCFVNTWDRQVNVAVISLPFSSDEAQEPARVWRHKRTDQQGATGLLVMSEESRNNAWHRGTRHKRIHLICAGANLWADREIPSLLHSTTTVDEGGGLTLQGSTTVWPTKASTLSGSLLSMLTPARVKLREHEEIRGKATERTRRNEGSRERLEEKRTKFTLCSTVGGQSKHKESPRPGFLSVSGNKKGKEMDGKKMLIKEPRDMTISTTWTALQQSKTTDMNTLKPTIMTPHMDTNTKIFLKLPNAPKHDTKTHTYDDSITIKALLVWFLSKQTEPRGANKWHSELAETEKHQH